MDPEVGAVHGDERLAQIAQRGLAARPELLLGDHDPHRPPILQPVEAMDARSVVANTPRRFLSHFDLGDQVAFCRIPPRELDASCFTDDAASSVGTDEIPRPKRLAARQLDLDAGVVLREAPHLAFVIDPYRQLGEPSGHDPLDPVLPDPERIWMTRREIAHVQHSRADHHGLSHLTLREEPIGDPALIQHFDRARVKTAGPRADEHVIATLLDDRDVDLRQRQLSRQHHSGRTASGDHHLMLGHSPPSLLP